MGNRLFKIILLFAVISLMIPTSNPIGNASAVITEDQKLTASDGAQFDNFGISVSISGDTAIVGALFDNDACPADPNCDSGSAYVFTRSGSTWTQQAKLTASDAAAGDTFGFSVYISGDTAIVGARFDSDAAVLSGSAYVFVKPALGWTDSTETAKLTASDAANFDFFGQDVSISVDTAIVGALFDDDACPSDPFSCNSGSAYVFVKPALGWADSTETAKLTASDGAADDIFGVAVSISGDTAMVGATGRTTPGSVYVFVKPGTGWSGSLNEDAKLTASDAAAGDTFGFPISISGDTAIFGGLRNDDACPADPLCNSGSAYVFTGSGATWTEQAKLTASDAAAGDTFGVGVSISGNTAIVGAIRDDDGGTNSGSAYVFVKPAEGWAGSLTETAKLIGSDVDAGDLFGVRVSNSGNTAIVGAVGLCIKSIFCQPDDDFTSPEPGAAYIFEINSPPVADANGPYLTEVTTPVNLDASASSDPDDNIATYQWDLDYDGITFEVDLSDTNPITSATFSQPGIFTIAVKVTDDAGEFDIAESLAVVYDPSGGFVTGGGWIDSPSGAFTADESLTGKANFGFVSKYKKGATIPTGVTEFQFKVADLNFHSDSYEFLVIAGAKAIYKGEGTINGEGNFGFLLSVIDADVNDTDSHEVDKFRIKIFDNNGNVYDNKVAGETDDNAAPTTEISGGSIKIHKAK